MTVTMTTKKQRKPKAPKLVPDELIDQLLSQVEGKDAESILGESGLAGLLKKQLAERMLAAELALHLEVEAKQGKAGNHRNGSSPKTVIAMAYHGDIEGWRKQISQGAQELGVLTATILEDRLTISDGREIGLSECRIEFD
jgi:hypothetical protein